MHIFQKNYAKIIINLSDNIFLKIDHIISDFLYNKN